MRFIRNLLSLRGSLRYRKALAMKAAASVKHGGSPLFGAASRREWIVNHFREPKL
jgi:hypothetical protein